jgi:hypothetical protein
LSVKTAAGALLAKADAAPKAANDNFLLPAKTDFDMNPPDKDFRPHH